MNCKQATRLISDSQERQLSLKEKSVLKVHVMMCSACRDFGDQIKLLRQISHNFAKGHNKDNKDNKD